MPHPEEKRIDLHIHSSFSEDADFTVREIFAMANDAGVSAIAITDHDSIDSIPEAVRAAATGAVEYLPGVELTTIYPRDGSQQHILGYFVDHDNPHLRETIARICALRVTIAQRRIEALARLGFALDKGRIWKRTGGRAPAATSIILEVFENEANRADPRLADYFQGARRDDRIIHFYREYFGYGAAAYVPFESITIDEGIACIAGAGGLPVLAHPKFVRDREWLADITDRGMAGIEAISTYHTDEDNTFFLGYAERKGLLVTAGSDFHGPTSKPLIGIGGIRGNDYRYVTALKERRAVTG